MAAAIDAGIRVTPPYGKSGKAGQMRLRDAAMRRLPGARDALSPSLGKGESYACAGRSATTAVALRYVAVAVLAGVIAAVVPSTVMVRRIEAAMRIVARRAVAAVAGLGRRLRWLRLRIGGTATV